MYVPGREIACKNMVSFLLKGKTDGYNMVRDIGVGESFGRTCSHGL